MTLFKNKFIIDNYHISISMSIGIAIYPFAGKSKSALLKNADIAMFLAKELGKNQYQFYSKTLNLKHARSLDIENGLKEALKNNEFSLVYQPQIDVRNNQIAGFEVLIRWHSPTLGFVSPVEFINKAEDMGLIHEIGLWILSTSCVQFGLWKERFEKYQMKPKLSVNLSVVQLRNHELINQVKKVMTDFKYPSSQLMLELTESLLVDNIEESKKVLEEIKGLGIGLAIDDFGTGYSSFGYLKTLPFTCLKIDKSFIDEIESNEDDRSIIKAIIHLAQVLNLKIVAEGVESKAQLHYFKTYDKELISEPILIQGYYYSKPLKPEDIIPYIESFYKVKT